MQITFQTILPFILAILLIFIIPMLAARRGMSYGEFVKSLFERSPRKSLGASDTASTKRSREPVLSNGRSNELTELVSTLLIFVRRNKIGMVYPGTILEGGEMTTVLCFIVTRARVFGINCFGYTGRITDGDGSAWVQRANGQEIEISDVRALNERQYDLTRTAMDRAGMENVPLEMEAVFTNAHAELALSDPRGVYTREGLLRRLREALEGEVERFDPQKTAVELKKLTTVMKPQARKSGRQ